MQDDVCEGRQTIQPIRDILPEVGLGHTVSVPRRLRAQWTYIINVVIESMEFFFVFALDSLFASSIEISQIPLT